MKPKIALVTVDREGVEEPVIVYNSFNARNRPKNLRMEYPASETVPDLSMTPREIVDRYTRKMPINGMKEPIYDEENLSSGINPLTLDRIDVENMTRENNEKLKKSRKQLEKERKEKSERDFNEAYEKSKEFVEKQKKDLDTTGLV